MIEQHGHELILKYATENCAILELGNQIMNLENTQGVPSIQYYRNLGYRPISVDQNGKDGAVQVNLCKPIEFLGKFHLVTDMGTSEHVKNLYECLINILNHCAPGTIIIHKNPKTGNFPNHGYHYFTLDFWKAWAELANLNILELYEHAIYHNDKDGWECIAILQVPMNLYIPTEKEFNQIFSLINQS